MCPLLEGSLTEIATFRTNHFVHYSKHVRYLGFALLGGFTVLCGAETLPKLRWGGGGAKKETSQLSKLTFTNKKNSILQICDINWRFR